MEFIITITVLDILIVLLIYQYLHRRYRLITALAATRLNYIRILIEIVYTYSHQPELLYKHLQKEMSIKRLTAYHVIDEPYLPIFKPHRKMNDKDRLFYMLHKEGFSPRELCVIFEMNNLNSVYVKCHRINKKWLHQERNENSRPNKLWSIFLTKAEPS